MSSPNHIDDPLTADGEDDHMELAIGSLLDDTSSNHDHTEQAPLGDEGAGFMEVTQAEPAAVPTAE